MRINLISCSVKLEDQALNSISTILKFSALVICNKCSIKRVMIKNMLDFNFTLFLHFGILAIKN